MPHDHDHSHSHDHAAPQHPPLRPDQDDTITYWRAMEIAVRALLIDKGILTADEVRRAVEDMDSRTPLQGARIVAKAWTDPDYRKLLLSDGNAACRALDVDGGILVSNGSSYAEYFSART